MLQPARDVDTFAAGPASFLQNRVFLLPPHGVNAPFNVNGRIQRDDEDVGAPLHKTRRNFGISARNGTKRLPPIVAACEGGKAFHPLSEPPARLRLRGWRNGRAEWSRDHDSQD